MLIRHCRCSNASIRWFWLWATTPPGKQYAIGSCGFLKLALKFCFVDVFAYIRRCCSAFQVAGTVLCCPDEMDNVSWREWCLTRRVCKLICWFSFTTLVCVSVEVKMLSGGQDPTNAGCDFLEEHAGALLFGLCDVIQQKKCNRKTNQHLRPSSRYLITT